MEVEAGRTPDNVRAWLHRVVANANISRARHASVSRRFASVLVIRDEPQGPEDIVIDAEMRTHVSALLATLPDASRAALLLAAHGYTGAEISTAVGRSNVATRTLMSRARQGLKSQLRPTGLAA